jgi:hypothetical protein
MAESHAQDDKEALREAVRRQNEEERHMTHMLANGQLPESMLPQQQKRSLSLASRTVLFEIVRENIEDFEMVPQAAVDDAIQTLALQASVAAKEDLLAALKMAQSLVSSSDQESVGREKQQSDREPSCNGGTA